MQNSKGKFYYHFWASTIAILLVFLAGGVSADITGGLTPDSISESISYDGTKTLSLDYYIEITGEGGGAVDVLFLTDTTGSMGGYINEMKTAFSGILTAIDACLPDLDIEYSVADYRNYTDGGNYTAYGVNLLQPFTDDVNLVQAAINSLSAGGGMDTPESQLKALVSISDNWLTEAGDLGFAGRAGAQKIIIWGGDAIGHIAGDETAASGPPPDGYYPTLDGTIAALNAQGILVFALNVYDCSIGLNAPYGGYYGQTDPDQQAYQITAATGGTLFCSVGTGGPSIQDAIVESITGGVETLTNITLTLEGDAGDFVIDPCVTTIIGSWTETNSPVMGTLMFDATAPGFDSTADFNMVLLGNGAELDRSAIHLTTAITQVAMGLKGGACPAPLNPKSNGVFQATIVGSDELDVADVNVDSISLGGAAPIQVKYKDIASPGDAAGDCVCLEGGSDGYMDLALQFDTQDIAAGLGEVSKGDILQLDLTATLMDGTPLAGTGCIRIVGNQKD